MEKRHRNREMRNLKSAGKATAKITGEAVNGLFRWLTTDHSGMGKAFGEMPKMAITCNLCAPQSFIEKHNEKLSLSLRLFA